MYNLGIDGTVYEVPISIVDDDYYDIVMDETFCPYTSIVLKYGKEYKVIRFGELDMQVSGTDGRRVRNLVIKDWNTDNITMVQRMFCLDVFNDVQSIDISSLEFANVNGPCQYIFDGLTSMCKSIKVSPGLWKWIKETAEKGYNLGGGVNLTDWKVTSSGNAVLMTRK